MSLLKHRALGIALFAIGTCLPLQAHASEPSTVPEPVSLALLAVGAAGVGAAAWIRRHRDK